MTTKKTKKKAPPPPPLSAREVAVLRAVHVFDGLHVVSLPDLASAAGIEGSPRVQCSSVARTLRLLGQRGLARRTSRGVWTVTGAGVRAADPMARAARLAAVTSLPGDAPIECMRRFVESLRAEHEASAVLLRTAEKRLRDVYPSEPRGDR